MAPLIRCETRHRRAAAAVRGWVGKKRLPEAVMADVGWSGALIAAIFVVDVVVFIGLVREDWRDHLRHRRHRRMA